MHRLAHTLFAMGISSLPYIFFDLPMISLILCVLSASILGSLPDIDFKLNITHRSWDGTHGPLFFIISATIFTVLVIGIRYVLYISHIDIHGFTLNEFGDIIFEESLFDFFIIWMTLFFAVLSHALIDLITHSGIDTGSHHVSGAFLSSSPVGNFIFSILGLFMVILTFIYVILVRDLSILSSRGFYIMLIIVVGTAFIIIMASIFIKRDSNLLPLYCGKRGKVGFCIVNSECVNIKGKKICFDKDMLSK